MLIKMSYCVFIKHRKSNVHIERFRWALDSNKKGCWLYMKEQSLKWESQFNILATLILVDKSSSLLIRNTCTFTLDQKEGVNV